MTVVPFNFDQYQVRTLRHDDGEVWFVAQDVCAALTIENNRDAVARLDGEEKGVRTMDTLGGTQEVAVINESGLYSLILTSRKPEAKRFKKWVTSEVLPSIRKTGGYSMAQPVPPSNFPDLVSACNALVASVDAKVLPKKEGAELIRAITLASFHGASVLLAASRHKPNLAALPAPVQPALHPVGTVNYFCRGSDTQSATSLIKSRGADITAKILHDLLEREGMMITKYYKQGEEATPYRVLIDDGIGYGQNVLHDDGSHSHPYYYVSKFNALMARVGAVGRSVSAVVAKPTKGEAALDKYKQIMREVWWEGERNMTVVDGKSKPHITYLASLRCLTKSKGMLEKTARNTLSPSGQMMSRLTLDGFCVPHKGGWAITDSDFVFSAPPLEAKVNSVA